MNALTARSLSSCALAGARLSISETSTNPTARIPAVQILHIYRSLKSAHVVAARNNSVLPQHCAVVRLESRHNQGTLGWCLAARAFAMSKRGHYATQGPDLLLGGVHAREHGLHVTHHDLPPMRRVEKSEPGELGLEMVEEAVELLLGRRTGAACVETGL